MGPLIYGPLKRRAIWTFGWGALESPGEPWGALGSPGEPWGATRCLRAPDPGSFPSLLAPFVPVPARWTPLSARVFPLIIRALGCPGPAGPSAHRAAPATQGRPLARPLPRAARARGGQNAHLHYYPRREEHARARGHKGADNLVIRPFLPPRPRAFLPYLRVCYLGKRADKGEKRAGTGAKRGG